MIPGFNQSSSTWAQQISQQSNNQYNNIQNEEASEEAVQLNNSAASALDISVTPPESDEDGDSNSGNVQAADSRGSDSGSVPTNGVPVQAIAATSPSAESTGSKRRRRSGGVDPRQAELNGIE